MFHHVTRSLARRWASSPEGPEGLQDHGQPDPSTDAGLRVKDPEGANLPTIRLTHREHRQT